AGTGRCTSASRSVTIRITRCTSSARAPVPRLHRQRQQQLSVLGSRGSALPETRVKTIAQQGDYVITILIILAVLMLLGAIPTWPHSRTWGYGPSGGLGLVLLIVVILLLTGRI